MNAVLHRKAEITIKSGNTFSNPQYLDKSDNSVLDRFDYIVANPPFSMKIGVMELLVKNMVGLRAMGICLRKRTETMLGLCIFLKL